MQSCDPHSFLEWIGAVDADISWYEDGRQTVTSCDTSYDTSYDTSRDLVTCVLTLCDFFCGFSENSSNSFLSSLVCPEPNTTLSQALRVSVCGLLLPQDIHRLIQQIRSAELTLTPSWLTDPYLISLSQLVWRRSSTCRCYLEQPRLASWVSLTVHGFADSPVSWGGNEHGVLRGGENFYSLLMFHDHTYHLHLATGAHDTCPPWWCHQLLGFFVVEMLSYLPAASSSPVLPVGASRGRSPVITFHLLNLIFDFCL